MSLTREQDTTISKWGEYPHERDVEDALKRSLVILDKPDGPTSHQYVTWVKKLFGVKTGHSGTLDPNATGVLPVGLGYSVRVVDLLHVTSKEYVAAMRFHGNVDEEEVERIVQEYEGEVYQTPPVRSNVKRERRKREIHDIEILDHKGRDYLLRVECQSGTYIRTLCKDIGKSIGVGGNMIQLRRTMAGGFKEDESYHLQEVKDAYETWRNGEGSKFRDMLVPYEKALDLYPGIKVKDTAAGAVLEGADLAVPGILEMDGFEAGETVSIFSSKKEGLAVGKALMDAEEIVEDDGGMAVQTSRVFHPTGKYPKKWK